MDMVLGLIFLAAGIAGSAFAATGRIWTIEFAVALVIALLSFIPIAEKRGIVCGVLLFVAVRFAWTFAVTGRGEAVLIAAVFAIAAMLVLRLGARAA